MPLQGATRKQLNSRRLAVLLYGDSVITPLRYVGDVTVVLCKRGCNIGPTPTKPLVPNLAELPPRQVVCMYQKRWAITLVHWERKSGLGLGEHQVSGMQDRSEQSVGIAVLAYWFAVWACHHEIVPGHPWSIF